MDVASRGSAHALGERGYTYGLMTISDCTLRMQ